MSSVDVIVPCYRYAHYLKHCVESILAQEGVDVRVLIIDDASPDNTPEVALELLADPRVQYRRHVSNKGLISTANEGIAWAQSDYVLLLSADDSLLPGAFARAAELMDQHPSIAFTFGGVQLDKQGQRSPMWVGIGNQTHVLTGREFISLSGAKNIVLSPTAIIRTSVQKKVGGYLPDLPHTSDMEMWLRLAAHGKVGVIASDQAVYRWHDTNMSGTYSPEQDLLQRKLALEHFLNRCGARLTNVGALRTWLKRDLALDTIRCASIAFNKGELDHSVRLCKLALEFDPGVDKSSRWWFLSCKRFLGPRKWQRLRPLVSRLRTEG